MTVLSGTSGTSGRPVPVTPSDHLADGLRRLRADLPDGSVVDADAGRLLDRLLALAEGLDPYLAAMTSPPSPALRTLDAATRAHDWDGAGGPHEVGMLSGHVEGRFLRVLTGAVRARRVLDVGLFTGYSALAMAEALPDDGRLVACELDPDVAAMAAEHLAAAPAGRKVEVRVGPAADTLRDLVAAGERFDLVFVDADKAGYAGYLDLAPDLLALGGLVCVDNTLMQGEPWLGATTENGRAIAEFNRRLADDPRWEQVVVPLRDGVTLARLV